MSKRRFASVFLIVLALVICTGTVYGQSSLSFTGNAPGGTNVQLVNVPNLAGNPGLTVNLTVASQDGTLTFTVTGKPVWLTVGGSLDTSTGVANLTLSTTPAALASASVTTAQTVTFALHPSDSSAPDPDLPVTLNLLFQPTPFTVSGTGTYSLGVYNGGATPAVSPTLNLTSPIVTTYPYTLDATTALPPWLAATNIPGSVA